eukprot:363990-Chlamydomonas_euryale.AAC.6
MHCRRDRCAPCRMARCGRRHANPHYENALAYATWKYEKAVRAAPCGINVCWHALRVDDGLRSEAAAARSGSFGCIKRLLRPLMHAVPTNACCAHNCMLCPQVHAVPTSACCAHQCMLCPPVHAASTIACCAHNCMLCPTSCPAPAMPNSA